MSGPWPGVSEEEMAAISEDLLTKGELLCEVDEWTSCAATHKGSDGYYYCEEHRLPEDR